MTFLFGNKNVMDREIAASAHNYYLDMIYNFGFISIFPFLIMIFLTAIKGWRNKRMLISDKNLFVLFVVVLFFILVDNSLKVGFKQPYPGIIIFFLWGILLNRLEQKK